jgi:hypothetical protein
MPRLAIPPSLGQRFRKRHGFSMLLNRPICRYLMKVRDKAGLFQQLMLAVRKLL